MQELTVKYKNEMNQIPLRKMTSVEMDFFFSVCAKMKNRDDKVARFTFDDIKELSNYQPTSLKRFVDDLEKTRAKIMNLSYIERDGLNSEMFVLFTRFKINADEKYIEVKTNDDFIYILNQLTNEFTQFELKEFTDLRSSYSKTMYRLLKQFKSSGYYSVKIGEFRELLDVPQSYRMTDINKQILAPIKRDLSPLFKSLTINKVKAKKGNRIDRLEFRFEKRNLISEEHNEGELPKIPMYNWLSDKN